MFKISRIINNKSPLFLKIYAKIVLFTLIKKFQGSNILEAYNIILNRRVNRQVQLYELNL